MEVLTSPENYLSYTNNPKLLLFCGHITNEDETHFYQPMDESYPDPGWTRDEDTDIDNDDGTNLRGNFMHQHFGWYTVDRDVRKYPDWTRP